MPSIKSLPMPEGMSVQNKHSVTHLPCLPPFPHLSPPCPPSPLSPPPCLHSPLLLRIPSSSPAPPCTPCPYPHTPTPTPTASPAPPSQGCLGISLCSTRSLAWYRSSLHDQHPDTVCWMPRHLRRSARVFKPPMPVRRWSPYLRRWPSSPC